MNYFERFSKQEFMLGALSSIFLMPKLGLYTCWLALGTGALWMLGGTIRKIIRRYGVPLLVGTVSCIMLKSQIPILSIPIAILVLHIGDGFPDHRPTTKNEGSALGRFVEKFIPDMEVGGIVTKLLVVAILQFAWIPIWVS